MAVCLYGIISWQLEFWKLNSNQNWLLLDPARGINQSINQNLTKHNLRPCACFRPDCVAAPGPAAPGPASSPASLTFVHMWPYISHKSAINWDYILCMCVARLFATAKCLVKCNFCCCHWSAAFCPALHLVPCPLPTDLPLALRVWPINMDVHQCDRSQLCSQQLLTCRTAADSKVPIPLPPNPTPSNPTHYTAR